MRAEVKEENPKFGPKEITSELGRLWRELDDKEKAKYGSTKTVVKEESEEEKPRKTSKRGKRVESDEEEEKPKRRDERPKKNKSRRSRESEDELSD